MSQNNLCYCYENSQLRKNIFQFVVYNIRGEKVHLDKYKGHVCIIVNVASNSIVADYNYKMLNKLYDEFYKEGLRILAFPCNQFGMEEPGSHTDIIKFAAEKNVKFDLFEKINVNGNTADPLWNFLKKSKSESSKRSVITSNFTKFVVNKKGLPIYRYGLVASEKIIRDAVLTLLNVCN